MLSIHELIDGQLERSNQGAVKATKRIYRFQCCCCGGEAPALQHWHNRDEGYGCCPRCFTEGVKRDGEAEAIRLYGKPGIHHSIAAVKATQPQGVQVFHEAGGSYLLIEDGKAVAARMTQAHAERFKLAINAHDALVEACKSAKEYIGVFHDAANPRANTVEVYGILKAALAKAERGQP